MSLELDALTRLIWETSRADEGTISVTGAKIIAEKVLASGYVWVPLMCEHSTCEDKADMRMQVFRPLETPEPLTQLLCTDCAVRYMATIPRVIRQCRELNIVLKAL